MKKTYSVGMSILNEGKNIRALLESILSQKVTGYELDTILLFDDGSTDDTESEVSKVASKKIQYIRDGERKGKSARLQQLYSTLSSHYLIQMDGDVMLKNNDLFQRILDQMELNKVDLGGVNYQLLPRKSFFSKVIVFGSKLQQYIRLKWNHSDNYLAYGGTFMVLSKKLAKKVYIDSKMVNHDTYLYLFCKENDLNASYMENIHTYIWAPANLADQYNQSNRFQISQKELEIYFKKDLMQYYSLPKPVLLDAMFRFFFKNPFYFFCYLLVAFTSRFTDKSSISYKWDSPKSTK